MHSHRVRSNVDPTHTTRLRSRFMAEVSRRFDALAKEIERFIVEDDALAIDSLEIKQHQRDFQFLTSAEKIRAFMRWLRLLERQHILTLTQGEASRSARPAWTSIYIETAYQKGIADAGKKLRGAGAKVGESWVREAFNRPVHADRAGIIFTRVYEELAGITAAMDRQISEALAIGISEGRNPLQIARRITDRVKKVGRARARLIARTEVINAHAEASLNAYEEAGVAGVEAEAEFTTAGDSRVCPQCKALEGRVYRLTAARGIIPVHPNAVLEGSTFVPYGSLNEIVRSRYAGPAVRISTDFDELTIGPNHPVLTSRGWVRAALLRKGDQLVHDKRHQTPVSSRKYNREQVPMIEDFFESGATLFGSQKAHAVAHDFHGDGIFCEGEIEVIRPALSLLQILDASLIEHLGERLLVRPDVKLHRVAGCGAPLSRWQIVALAAARGVGLGGSTLSFLLGHSGCRQSVGVADRSVNAGPFQDFPHVAPAACQLLRHSIGAHAVPVQAQNLSMVNAEFMASLRTVSRDRAPTRLYVETDAASFALNLDRHYSLHTIKAAEFVKFRGWAFDASTSSGAFASNGYYTKNCRCAWLPVIQDARGVRLNRMAA